MKKSTIAIGIALCMAAGIALTGCMGNKHKPGFTVLIRMMPAQQRFFEQEIVAKFNKEHNCAIRVASFEKQWDIERFLTLDAAKKHPEIGLVKTPFEVTRPLVYKGLMMPLTQAVDSAKVMMDLAEYHQLAAGLGYVNGEPYYIPRKLETRIMFYRKSMVADAVAKFEKHRARINAELKKQNGFGLPAGYVLESDPSAWDLYDVYVVGSIWSHETYNGVVMPRIAHRGARYEGTALDLVDRSLQFDSVISTAQQEIMSLGKNTAQTLLWENVFIRNAIYNPSMWQDQWTGDKIWNGIKDGKVFLSFVQQIDCFYIHGWADDPGMPSYLPDINDMGLAQIPLAVSFDLKADGTPQVVGTRAISTGGWWWGIPKTSPDAQLAYEFARYITNKTNNALECSKFGMVPVRKDILLNLPEVFSAGWVGDIFRVSVDQIGTNGLTTVPLDKEYPQLAQNIIEAWYTLCVGNDQKKSAPMTLPLMTETLKKDFLPQVKRHSPSQK